MKAHPNDAATINARLRALPQVERLLAVPEVAALAERHGRAAAVGEARSILAEARAALRTGIPGNWETAELSARLGERLRVAAEQRLRRVINATGVVLHTNLGRAPIGHVSARAAFETATAYTNLEFDLETGRRGARTQGVEPLLRQITGSEAALAVNNAAAAVLLALSALAAGGEVIVSRGELVEIGGGFRIPEVIAQGGARLVEVGATNKTRLADYAAAITPATRVLLKVHQSNYRITGFTGEATLAELSGLAEAGGLVLMHDLGGGALVDLTQFGLPPEPTVQDSLRAGAHLVAFSGDKLMGGPQAGLLVGRVEALAPLRRHPLLRALRLDKMTLAALEATLQLYRDPARALREVPALAMLGQEVATLQARAERLATRLKQAGFASTDLVFEATTAFAGGGTLPTRGRESRALILGLAPGAETLARRLRRGTPPVVARIAGGRLVLDMLTVGDEELDALANALVAALEA